MNLETFEWISSKGKQSANTRLFGSNAKGARCREGGDDDDNAVNA